ncbi:ABC transporter substrate-binding protein [Stappia sp. 22II-S9-Z10]|nr:ABC transporter substrate-binding protein [Stappia sp. 22II-S9-Z10]
METRANYVAIGIFVLVVLAGAFGSLWWLYKASGSGATAVLRIIFPEAVTGLSTGAGVYFNGIRVGEVTSLEFPPEGGDNVIAITRVNPTAPIKTDTQAQLASQGLTGVSYVSLVGGSGSAVSIFQQAEEEDKVPTIEAATSAFTNVIDTLQSVLGRLDSTLGSVNDLVSSNQGNVSDVVANVRTITDNFAQASPQIPAMVADFSAAASAIGTAAPQIAGVVESANGIIGAIDPARVSNILANVDTFSGELPGIGNQVTDIVTNVNGVVTRVQDAADTLNGAIQSVNDVAQAIDAEAVNAILGNVRTASAVVAEKSADIGVFIDNATRISTDVASISETIAQRREQVSEAIENASALIADARAAVAAAAPAIQGLGEAIAAVPPERVTGIVDNVETVTQTLAGQSQNVASLVSSATEAASGIADVTRILSGRSEAIGTTLDQASTLVTNLSEASARVPAIAASAETLLNDAAATVRAVDAERINAVVANVEGFTATIAGQGPAITDIIASTRGTTERAEAIASAIAQRMPAIGSAIDDAAATVASARSAADRLPELVAALEPGITNVSAALSAVDPAAIEAIMENAASLSETLAGQGPAVERIINRVEGVMVEASSIAADLRVTVEGIASRREAINAAIDNAAAAVASVREAADRAPQIVAALEPGVTNLSDALSAIDPAAVEAIMGSVRGLADTVSAQTPAIEAIIASTRGTMAEAEAIATSLSARMPEISGAIDNATASIADVRLFAARLPELATSLEPGIDNISAVLSAIDPAAIEGVVANVRTLSETLAANAPRVETILASADRSATNVETITTRLTGEMDTVTAMLDNANGAVADVRTFTATLPALRRQIDPAIDSFTEAMSAVDPVAVRAIVGNVRDFTITLSDQRETIDSIVGTVGAATQRIDQVAAAVSARSAEIGNAIDSVSSFAGQLRDAGPSIDGIVANVSRAASGVADTVSAIDTDAINAILANARVVATTVGARAGEIGTAIDDAVAGLKDLFSGLSGTDGEDGFVKDLMARLDRIAANVEGASSQLGGLINRANVLLGTEVERVFAGVNGATASIRDVAAAFAPRADQIAGGLSRFSQGGLDDLRALLNQGRSTLQAIESAVSSFDRDPSRVIFGGDDAPRYSPQRR